MARGQVMMRAMLIAALAVAASATSFCPLCGEFPTEQPPPTPNGPPVTFNFDICCPFRDTMEDNCIVNSKTESNRTTGLSSPITASLGGFVELCMSLDDFMFETSDRSPCCDSCTCFGDPNCVSFDGTKETWVVCDARTVSSNPNRRKFCPLTEGQCLQETDPAGEACVWRPTEENIPLKDWSIKAQGSPCAPTETTFIQMYRADSFNLRLGQGERGNLIELDLSLGNNDYSLTAANCVNKGPTDSWTGSPINGNFQRTEEMYGKNNNNDIKWHVYDPDTKIGVEIRCTAHLVGGELVQARMNVENIYEPDPNFRNNRRRLNGFCVNNGLGNPSPSPNTMFIEENNYCTRNGPMEDVVIARSVCENQAILANGVGQCYKEFCNQFYIPYYDSFDECFEVISNTSNPDHWIDGFCGAFTQLELDFFECEQTIKEFGWDEAVNIYYSRDRPTEQCVSSFDELPTALEECEPGVLLQYLNEETDTWVTVKAFSEIRPPCNDAVLQVCYEENPELFDNKIRWIQFRNTENCLFGTCTRQDGFAVRLRTEVTTLSPTNSPSSSPTSSPTPLPTSDPTPEPTADPTEMPTPEPTPEPTNEPTSEPTSDPTPEPTPEPTNEPTSEPTSDPTPEPSPGPTNDPTAEPTPEPTNEPTSLPTNPPRSETTGQPSASPIELLTDAPTSSPRNVGPPSPPSPCPPAVKPCPLISNTVPAELPEGTFRRIVRGRDVVYIVIEPESQISTKIRCTANFQGNRARNSRLGIEDLIDPFPQRQKQCGYCPTDIMGRTGSTENTDSLDESGACNSRPEPVEIGQAICAPYLQFETFDECLEAICSRYWFPNYNNPEQCVNVFNNNPENGFCRLFTVQGTPDFQECKDDIADFGWPFAAERYMPDPSQADCSSDPTDFPKELSDCQTGVEIQYLNSETGTWITHRAIPSDSNRPVCTDGLLFPAGGPSSPDFPLFVNPVRIKQRSLPRDTCITVSTCTVTERVDTELLYERTSTCAGNPPPTPQPSVLPPVTGVTLCNEVYNSNTCTNIPQVSGSSPSSFEATLAEMDECCAPKDTQSLTDQPLDQNYEFERYAQACNPICDPNDQSACCDELTSADSLRVKVVFSGSERDALCCESCTCYGDPRCISFSGQKRSWIPCDARDAATADDRNFCLSTQALCESLEDPAGNMCQWFPSGSTSLGWSVLQNGGPCKAVGAGEFSCLTMYETETFGMCLKQGDRGILVDAVVRLGNTEYMINADECLSSSQPWRRVVA